ncbi:hypothetical protein VTJ49DRAFT_2186 [Mycothermus thermophilus]|uniref:Rhodopsin domain-containing protein n=1 Tax=Humicola insolens TaxID=85995 RepID=A0ABR3VAG9_HUMIN
MMELMDVDPGVDYGPQLNALNWLLVSLSGLFLFTRLYLKNSQNRGLWWDDWILLASWIALVVSVALVAYLISLGYGKKVIPLANVQRFGLPGNILSSVAIIANLWGKTSFGVTLLRIPVRWMRVSVWYILASLTLTLTTSVLFVWVECGPFKLSESCIPVGVSIRYNVFSCAYSGLVDVVFAFLPWKYLLQQQMNKKEKLGATVAMSMGVFAGATAAVKASTIPTVAVSRGSIPLVALGTAESAICIIAASVPILRALSRNAGPVVNGYETDYPTTMVDSSLRGDESSTSQLPPVPRGQRWSAVSASGNIDTAYRQLWNTPEKAYQFICWCRPPFPEPGDDEDDEDEDDEPACDGGKTCLCGKPAADHPDHKWIATHAARRKFIGQIDMAHFRDPNNFGLKCYQDTPLYGIMEVVENLLLDFVEADRNWREQWVVCETMAFFMHTDLAADMGMVDDGEGLDALMRLVGRTFLAMLARLERDNRLGPDSEVKNLGLIMSLYVAMARQWGQLGFFEDGKEETVELAAVDGSSVKYTFNMNDFPDYVLGYAARHSIRLPDMARPPDDAAEKLPVPTKEDPWNTASAFLKYEKMHGKTNGYRPPAIGGDKLDITTWSSAQRKSASPTGQDPLSKRELEKLRMGMLLSLE